MLELLTESLMKLVQPHECMYRHAYIASIIYVYFQVSIHTTCSPVLLLLLLVPLIACVRAVFTVLHMEISSNLRSCQVVIS
jgi:hypothetical protein